jgi:hypothetical protein
LVEVFAEAGSRTSGAGAGGESGALLRGFFEEELLAMRKDTHFLSDRKGLRGKVFCCQECVGGKHRAVVFRIAYCAGSKDVTG